MAEPLPPDHHGHGLAADLDEPHSLLAASGVASSVGPRTARAALSARLSQARVLMCTHSLPRGLPALWGSVPPVQPCQHASLRQAPLLVSCSSLVGSQQGVGPSVLLYFSAYSSFGRCVFLASCSCGMSCRSLYVFGSQAGTLVCNAGSCTGGWGRVSTLPKPPARLARASVLAGVSPDASSVAVHSHHQQFARCCRLPGHAVLSMRSCQQSILWHADGYCRLKAGLSHHPLKATQIAGTWEQV